MIARPTNAKLTASHRVLVTLWFQVSGRVRASIS